MDARRQHIASKKSSVLLPGVGQTFPRQHAASALRGMSLIDVIVGVGIMLMVFLSVFAAYQLSIDLVLNTKARTGGLSLVSQQLEYVRGLPYDSLGTAGGIPSGSIPQTQTQVLNSISYTIKTLIQYYDDPADGSSSADTNSITADYKEVKVTATWVVRNRTYTTFAVTRISPHSIETLANGGTLKINVFDANAAAVVGATIRVQNASTSPAIDVTVSSDSTGSANFPGAPAASNYKISVSKSGYSSAQTYDVSGSNPNPNPGNVTIVDKRTTTSSFAIDLTGSLLIATFSPVATGFFDDPFADQSKLSATTSTTVSGAALRLTTTGPGGAYASSGTAQSSPIQPSLLYSWDSVTWTGTTPANTTRSIQVYGLSGSSYVLIPDALISGNSAGLTSGSVSLAAVSTTTYPALELKAMLGSSAASSTPTMTDWQVNYHSGPSPLPNVAFSIHGAKAIGTTAGGSPVYKLNQNNTTSALGTYSISPIEWDSYTVTPTGTTYDVAEQCPSALAVAPGQSQSVALQLMSHTTNSLRVVVTTGGAALSGATVTLSGTGGGTGSSSSCGQYFFTGVSSGNHTLTVSKAGLQTSTQTISVSGGTVANVTLSP